VNIAGPCRVIGRPPSAYSYSACAQRADRDAKDIGPLQWCDCRGNASRSPGSDHVRRRQPCVRPARASPVRRRRWHAPPAGTVFGVSRRSPSGVRMASTPISSPCAISTERLHGVIPARGRCPCQRLDVSTRRASAEIGRSGTPLASAYFLAKCCASSRMSAGRSRNGGIFRFTTLSRNNRSSRNGPSRTASARLRFEVAMMRISTGTGPRAADAIDDALLDRPPAIWIATARPISEISCEQQVPPVASVEFADTPRDGAGGTRPFSWPNSSDSSRSRELPRN